MTHVRTLPALSLLLAGFALPACTKPKTDPTNQGPGSVTAARKYLEGQWTLLSFTIYPPSAAPIEMKGNGTLIYDDFGNLSMNLVPNAATAAVLQKAGIPLENGRFASKGRTVLDMQNRTLAYVLEGQPAMGVPTGPLAANKLRYWQVDGTTLTLTTKDAGGKPLTVATWQKH